MSSREINSSSRLNQKSRSESKISQKQSPSVQIAQNLVSSNFDELPSCNELIKIYLKLQELVISLSTIQTLGDFYRILEEKIVSIVNSTKATLWIPFPSQQILVSPTTGQTMNMRPKYQSVKNQNSASLILKENHQLIGVLDISFENEISDSLFWLLTNITKHISSLLNKFNQSLPNFQDIFGQIFGIITSRNSSQLQIQCANLKTYLKCQYLEPFSIHEGQFISLFDHNDNIENLSDKIHNSEPFISNEMIIWPLLNSKRAVSFCLVAKNKVDNVPFNSQDQQLISIFSPLIHFTIQNLTSLDKKRKQLSLYNHLSSLSDIIKDMASSNDSQQCLGDLIRVFCDVYSAEYASFFLVESNQLNCCLTVGFTDRILPSMEEQPFLDCLNEKAPVIVNSPITFDSSITANTSLLLPVFNIHDELKGILYMMNKPTGFDSHDIRIGRFFTSLCSCALSISKVDTLKLFNQLIISDYKSPEFAHIAERISGIKSIQIVRVETNYPINSGESTCDYLQIDNGEIEAGDGTTAKKPLTPFQKKFCRYLCRVSSLMAEKNALRRLTSFDQIITDFMERKDEEKIGVPSALTLTRSQKERFNTLDVYTFDLENLRQVKMLFYIAEQLDLFKQFKINARALFNFIFTVKSKYQDNPYHNWSHALDVLQFHFVIARASGINEKLKPIEQLALYISLISHDIGHVGFSNNFLKQAKMPLSMLFNRSILETFHLSNLIQIMSMPGMNFIQDVDPEDQKIFWETSVHIVLMTDMERHKEFLETWDQTIQKGIDWDNPIDRITILSMFMKVSDISNCARPFEIAKKWAKRILNENFNQGDKEVQLGFGYSAPLTNRHQQKLPNSQIGFYKFICLPMFQKLAETFPTLQFLVDNINHNLDIWKEMDAKNINE